MRNKIVRTIISFVLNNRAILFFISTSFIKLYIISTFIVDVRWSWTYEKSIVCSFFSAAFLFIPTLFFNKNKDKISIMIASALSIILFIDVIYFSYYSSIPSVGLIGLIGLTSSVKSAISEFIKPLYFFLFIDIIAFTIFSKSLKKTYEEIGTKLDAKKEPSLIKKFFISIFLTTCLICSIFISDRTTLSDVYEKAYDNVSTMQYYGLLVTHAIDIIRFIDQETSDLSTNEKNELYNWVKNNKPEQKISSLNGITQNKNIIIIQVESLGSFPINQTINNKEITPNLNNLTNSTYYFPNNRFILGAGHTSDTDFVVNTSYFPLDNAAAFVRFRLDDMTSLPKLLKNNGYSVTAYHGFVSNFWSRDIAYSSLGYDRFYSASDYPDGEKINMGLNDGLFLEETVKYLIQKKQPSFSSIVTLSSHVPFEITGLTKELGLKQEDYPDQVAGYLENINYVDRMLGIFFEKLKDANIYDDSLIILFGDHTPVLSSFVAGDIKYDQSSEQSLEVPIFIKLPNQTEGRTFQKVGTNLDIMPTVLDLVGIKTTQLMFGQSLFAQIENNIETCSDQIVRFIDTDDCRESLLIEKNISDKIIRYNQFKYLP